jgi:hypothetical protein
MTEWMDHFTVTGRHVTYGRRCQLKAERTLLDAAREVREAG